MENTNTAAQTLTVEQLKARIAELEAKVAASNGAQVQFSTLPPQPGKTAVGMSMSIAGSGRAIWGNRKKFTLIADHADAIRQFLKEHPEVQ